MKIVAMPCLAADLRPGDLFSSVGPEYWDSAHLGINEHNEPAVGIKCYIRTEAQPKIMAQNLEQVYRLHIVPTELEHAMSEEALRNVIDADEEAWRYRPNLEVVPDDNPDMGDK